MEELGRMEEKMKETRMRERERRRAEARERGQKNIALWDERQKFNLSAKISQAFKFSYFLLLIHDSRSLLIKMTKTTSSQAARTAVVALQAPATALVVPAKVQQIHARHPP